MQESEGCVHEKARAQARDRKLFSREALGSSERGSPWRRIVVQWEEFTRPLSGGPGPISSGTGVK